MLQFLSFVGFGRNLIKERQTKGIKIAQKNGVKFGRRKALADEQVEEIKNRIAKGGKKESASTWSTGLVDRHVTPHLEAISYALRKHTVEI